MPQTHTAVMPEQVTTSKFDQRLQRRVPVSVLTGFLGSGKTTVLNHLVQDPALNRTLVVVNEFGEIGLDHDLMAHSADRVVIEMSSGCLCCTIRGDLAETLREAPARFAQAGKPWFDRVVIETTGLADPAPILHTLMTESAIARRYRLDGVVATIDTVNGDDTLDRQVESVKQAAVADRLILTKTDLAQPQKLRALRDRLRALNPGATQLIAEHGAIHPQSLFDAGLFNPTTKTPDVQRWLKSEAYTHPHGHQQGGHGHAHHHNQVNRHDAHIKALCVTIDEPISSAAFEAWLEVLLLYRGADFLRGKGIVNLAEFSGPVVIHGVQHIFHPAVPLEEWPSEDRRSRIVFITRDIDEAVLRDTLKLFTEAKAQPTTERLPERFGDGETPLPEVQT